MHFLQYYNAVKVEFYVWGKITPIIYPKAKYPVKFP